MSLIDPATPAPAKEYDYIAITKAVDFSTAAKLCADLGAVLPMPKTLVENNALEALASGKDYWLGLR